jgi:phosphate transport system permease protein
MKKTGNGTDRFGQIFTWFCGGALALNLLLTIGLVYLIAVNGLAYFWQKQVVLFSMQDGTTHLGEVWGNEEIPDKEGATRTRIKVGNRDLYGMDFLWIDDADIASKTTPADATVLERLEWGNFYGTMHEIRRDGIVLAQGPEAVAAAFPALHAEKTAQREAAEHLEKGPIGDLNHEIEQLRLERKRVALQDLAPDRAAAEFATIDQAETRAQAAYEIAATELFARRDALALGTLVMKSSNGRSMEMPIGEVVRAVHPNALSTADAVRLYFAKIWEFISDDPRESNTEGGIFPAIFGTVMMVFILAFLVAPFGVLAALYLREYATEGPAVRAVRIAVNNLAGVPSIVFGVFGLGFFVYGIGGSLDQIFYPESLPTPTFGTGGIFWGSLTLALLTVPVVIVATEEGLAAVPRAVREGSLALGATKFETTWKVVVPAAAPGILTGMILAMARAAGEVAPLMIVGMVKLAPTLPIDHHAPFIHLERKFMHLGFHIYDVGFQSPNVEAAQPLVFATALLLVTVVTLMNLVAIVYRNKLRARYATSAV